MMEEYKLYVITIAAVAIAILTVYFAVKTYKKKKRALEAEIEQAHAQLHQTEIQTQRLSSVYSDNYPSGGALAS